MKSECKIDSFGTKRWWSNDKYHREDGPAIEYTDGSKEWYLNGKLHRINAPATEYINGNKEWYLNGKLHRVDGPAIESDDKKWYLYGELHRVDGPAIENTKEYYILGFNLTIYSFNKIVFILKNIDKNYILKINWKK